MQINKNDVASHLEFLLKATPSAIDGRFEVSTLKAANHYKTDNLEEITKRAIEFNESWRKSTYIVPALLNKDIAPFGRSNDNDFHASMFVWADIDEEHDPEDLKQLYSQCKPNAAVITSRKPHRRIQLYWLLKEPCTEPDTLRRALFGVAQALGGDTSVTNPTSLMRLGGTINYPNDKKREKDGRIDELTEFVKIHDAAHNISDIMQAFPAKSVDVSGNHSTVPQSFDDGKPREALTGKLKINKLLELSKQSGKWHHSMRDAIASMVARGWNEEQIRTTCAPYCDNGAYDPDLGPLIASAHAKYGIEGQMGIAPVSSNTGQIKDRPPLTFTKAKDFKVGTEDLSLVKDVLNQGELSVIYGESNCGKTFFMTDLAIHIARGAMWRDKRVAGGPVVYAALEGASGLQKRYIAHCKHYNIDQDMPFILMSSQLDFYSDNANIDLFIEGIKQEVDQDPKLIVIDTLARALAGGDENSGQDMGMLVHYADLIRAETNAHLAFVHHSGKNKALGARGHSSLRAAVDTEIEISRNDGADQSIIKFVKQREMDMIEDMAFTLEPVVIGTNGLSEEVTSCVVTPIEPEESAKDKRSLTPIQKFVYEVIQRAIQEHGQDKYPYKDGPLLKVITYEQLGDALDSAGYDDMHNKDGERTALKHTKNIRVALRDKNLISFNGGYIWELS